MFFMSNMSKIFRCLFSVRICTIFSPSSLSGTTIIYCLYYYSFSIHFRDHLAIILNVTVGFLSLFYLVLFTPIVLISFLLGPFCQLSPQRRLFKLCTRAYINSLHKVYAQRIQSIYSYCTQNRRSHNQNQTIFANFDIFFAK